MQRDTEYEKGVVKILGKLQRVVGEPPLYRQRCVPFSEGHLVFQLPQLDPESR
jgi:hypothetical protein